MFHVGRAVSRSCQGLTRREILQVGGVGFLGLSLADSYRAQETRTSTQTPVSRGAREPACIFIFLSGGPSHFETFDPKPAAPIDIRGPYGTTATSVSGIQISELLPRIATHMNKCAIVRSMTSSDGGHSGVTMLSGATRGAASYDGTT